MLIQFMGDATLERPGHAFEGRAATQRDLDRWETWVDRDLLKYNQEKCQVWPLGLGNCSAGMRTLNSRGSGPERKTPGSSRANSLPGTGPADQGMW